LRRLLTEPVFNASNDPQYAWQIVGDGSDQASNGLADLQGYSYAPSNGAAAFAETWRYEVRQLPWACR
jgi:hypothetical protein